MRYFSAADIDAALEFPALVDALAAAFRGGLTAPTRHHHAIPPDATHLLMPAWTEPQYGTYVLQSATTGETLAVLDGTRLTQWRTAAASALAARFLARAEASKLLIVGAGALAPFLLRAHASQRPIDSVEIWNHRVDGARKLAARLVAEGFRARAVESLEEAVPSADIVSAATLSEVALIRGAWLRPGQHVDLVGAFNMRMREADDLALTRARVFIDTPAALSEGGDVARAIAAGALSRTDIVADLAALTRGAPGRGGPDEITLFKSVGASIEDLAAAMLVWGRATGAGRES
jgi:ornithine cyclodeaminase